MNPALHCAGVELMGESLRRNGVVRFRVAGASMYPLLRAGDVVQVERVKPLELRCGDVVAFERGGAILVHRVINFQRGDAGTTLQTKGDAFADADAPLKAHEILGRVTVRQRSGRAVALGKWPQRIIAKLAAVVSASAPLWFRPAQRIRRALRTAGI